MRNKSIKKHIIAVSLMIVLIPILIIGIFSCLSNQYSATNEVRSIVAEIAEASTVQTHMISQVTQGIEQIADVIQTNSATAEESAAASKELSNQALILKKMVGGFKLR